MLFHLSTMNYNNSMLHSKYWKNCAGLPLALCMPTARQARLSFEVNFMPRLAGSSPIRVNNSTRSIHDFTCGGLQV